jgi:hypothetical protein
MPRKNPETKRKGKDKAKDHYKKMGKYDGKATRRIVTFLEQVKPVQPI